LRVPGIQDLYSLDQFGGRLASPGVSRKRLAGGARPSPAGTGTTPPSLAVEKRGSGYFVSAQSVDELSSIRVSVDGQVVRNVNVTGSVFSNELSVGSIKGRWISFVAEDKQKLRSVTRAFLLGKQSYPGTLNVLSFGVDHF